MSAIKFYYAIELTIQPLKGLRRLFKLYEFPSYSSYKKKGETNNRPVDLDGLSEYMSSSHVSHH